MIIKDVEVLFVAMNPESPLGSSEKDQSPYWIVIALARDKAEKTRLTEAGLNMLAVVPDEDDPEDRDVKVNDGKMFWKCGISRKEINQQGKTQKCPPVVDLSLNPVSPDTVGRGSICNVMVYLYENEKKPGKNVAVLMKLQVVRHVVQEPMVNEEFEESTKTTEIVNAATMEEDKIEY